MKKEEIRKNNLPTSDNHLGGGTLESKGTLGGKRRKILLIIIGILLTLGIVIGTSYAWWTHIVSQSGINNIESTCLEIGLVDENSITLQNAYPITDAEAKLLTPYTFTITNKCNTIVEYDVNLDIMESSNRLNSNYIAIEFNGGEKRLLNTLESVEVSYPKNDYTPVEGRYLTSGELNGNESVSYTLKLWMDESVTIENDAMNKSFLSKVVVTGKQSHKVRLVDYVMNDNETEKFTHEETYQTKALTDYRYTGANPNNYVCFGSEEIPCPEDNLYRIIGVMPTQSEVGKDAPYENRVKLIKAREYDTLYWDTSDKNIWATSSLNAILKGTFWNSLGEYQNYIASSVWHIGALPTTRIESDYVTYLSGDEAYLQERGNSVASSGGAINHQEYIGLMYPSDYLYSNGLSYRSTKNSMSQSSLFIKTWLYAKASYDATNQVGEWLISPNATHLGYHRACSIMKSAVVMPYPVYKYNSSNYYAEYDFIVRPTFYLKSNVLYKSGNGTQESPYRISINE